MKDFRVHSLDAKYVGPFEHLYIEFPNKKDEYKDEAEVHIFTGENGTGKSTILYLLTCYPNTHLINPRIQLEKYEDFEIAVNFGFVDKSLEEENKRFQSVKYSTVYNRLTYEGVNRHDGFIGEYFATTYDVNFAFNFRYDFAMFAYSGYRRIDNPQLESIKEIKEVPLVNALNFHSSSNPQLLMQWIANVKTQEALALVKGENENARNYTLSLNKLQNALSEITRSNIVFELEGSPLDVYVKWDGKLLKFEVLPDGLKSIISWLGDLVSRMYRIPWTFNSDIFDRNFILFLDEIDIHLHPAWQRKILPVVKKLFKNAQIFVSTHSPFVVGSVDGAWVYRLKKMGQYSVLGGEPMLSEDAKSYQTILEETFGIKENFGEAIERKLEEFYDLRRRILIGELSFDDTEFQSLAFGLAEQSIELESIIGFELRQLKKIKGIKENIHA